MQAARIEIDFIKPILVVAILIYSYSSACASSLAWGGFLEQISTIEATLEPSDLTALATNIGLKEKSTSINDANGQLRVQYGSSTDLLFGAQYVRTPKSRISTLSITMRPNVCIDRQSTLDALGENFKKLLRLDQSPSDAEAFDIEYQRDSVSEEKKVRLYFQRHSDCLYLIDIELRER